MALTDKLSIVGQAWETYLTQAVGQNELPVKDVWYDMDSAVPRTPAVIIEPQGRIRDMQETGFTTVNTFNIHFTVMHSRLGSEGSTKRECLVLAETLEDLLHENRRLGNILVHSYVQSIELGIASRERVTLRAARLVWQGISKTRL